MSDTKPGYKCNMSQPAADVILGIRSTGLGEDLLSRVNDSVLEGLLGWARVKKIYDSWEDYDYENGVVHEDPECLCYELYSPYMGCREWPCTCKSLFWAKADWDLLNALPADKLVVFPALVEFGLRMETRFSYTKNINVWPRRPVKDFLIFSQKLDDVALAVCRRLLDAENTDPQKSTHVVEVFDTLQKAQEATPTLYQDVRHVYFYHSMALLKKWHTTEMSYLIYKMIDGKGLPDELVDMVREFYIESKEEDMIEREHRYYKTIKDRHNLDAEHYHLNERH